MFDRWSSGLNFNRRRRREKTDKAVLRRIVLTVFRYAVIILLAFILVYFWGYRITMSGSSMKGTLASGDHVLVNRLIYQVSTPDEGDVIVFAPDGAGRSSYSIKRIVAGPGDTVKVEDGYLYVNGNRYTRNDKSVKIDNPGTLETIQKVPEQQYFVLGDNPESSEDSRFSNIGTIDRDEIIGKVWFVIRPLSHFGRVK